MAGPIEKMAGALAVLIDVRIADALEEIAEDDRVDMLTAAVLRKVAQSFREKQMEGQ